MAGQSHVKLRGKKKFREKMKSGDRSMAEISFLTFSTWGSKKFYQTTSAHQLGKLSS